MRRVVRHRIFMKYLLTYLLTLLLPTLLLMAFVYQGFIERLQQEVVAGSINTLDKSRTALDEQMKRVEELTSQMLIEQNRLSAYRISKHPGYRAWGIVEELKRYAAVHAFVHDIWLYYRGEETIYTSSSVYRLAMLLDQVYPFSGWPKAEMVADLNDSRQTKMILPSSIPGSSERYLQIVVPVLPNQSDPYATLVYLIRESTVRQMLSNHYRTGGSTWIFDSEKRLITGVGPHQDTLSDQVAQLLHNKEVATYEQVTFDGKSFYLFVLESTLNNWNYVTLLPVAEVMNSVQQAKQRSLYGMALILLGGGLIVFYSMRWNYRPIRQLKLESEKLMTEPTQSSPTLNELETVQYAMQSLANRNRELDERVRSQASLVKRQWLLALLRGQVESVEELEVFGKETGFFIQGEQFRVAIIKWAPQSIFAQQIAVEGFEANILPPIVGHGVEHPDPDRFILLLSEGSEDQPPIEGLYDLWQRLREASGESVTIGIGTACSVVDIPRSYLEADTALSHRFIQGTDRLIDFADIQTAATLTERYPQLEMDRLQQAIRNGQADQVEARLRTMICFIREKHPTLFAARGLCLDMIRTVNAAWEKMGLDDSNLHRYPDVFSLESIETLDAFEQLIQEVCRDLCQLMDRSTSNDGGERSLEAMQRYIHEHYQDCEFSFQSMAIHFGMALSNLSQLFKDQCGSTLLDYTTDLRMNKAKEYLLQSDDTLKTVAESVGYYNVSSFIRRFKKWTGATPGEYRQRHKEEVI